MVKPPYKWFSVFLCDAITANSIIFNDTAVFLQLALQLTDTTTYDRCSYFTEIGNAGLRRI